MLSSQDRECGSVKDDDMWVADVDSVCSVSKVPDGGQVDVGVYWRLPEGYCERDKNVSKVSSAESGLVVTY